ncbi:hypothetical protein ADUPG1_008268, partial [Aduncisulcus paluster]
MNSTAIAIIDRHGSYVCDFEDKSEAQSAYKFLIAFNKSFVRSPPPPPPADHKRMQDDSYLGIESTLEGQYEPHTTKISPETPVALTPDDVSSVEREPYQSPEEYIMHEKHDELIDPVEQKRLAKIAQAEEKKRKKEEEKRKKEEEKRKKEEAKRHAAENKQEEEAQYAEQDHGNNTTGIDTESKISDAHSEPFSGPMYVDYQDESSQEHEPAYTPLTAAALKRINSGEIQAMSLDARPDPDSMLPPPLSPSHRMSQLSHHSTAVHDQSSQAPIGGSNNMDMSSRPSQLAHEYESTDPPHLVSNPLFTHVLDLEKERQWLGESGKEGGKGRERQWETSRLKQRLNRSERQRDNQEYTEEHAPKTVSSTAEVDRKSADMQHTTDSTDNGQHTSSRMGISTTSTTGTTDGTTTDGTSEVDSMYTFRRRIGHYDPLSDEWGSVVGVTGSAIDGERETMGIDGTRDIPVDLTHEGMERQEQQEEKCVDGTVVAQDSNIV